MKKYLLFYFFLLFSVVSFSQGIDFNHYQVIVSANPLPKDITVSAQKKASSAKSGINSGTKKRDKKAQESFYVASNYALDALLRSGRILFNDPVSEYATRVFKQLTEGDQTAENIRIYIIRSSAVNAFATQDGIIFITMGMIAQLSTEAQLAFILAHEFIHYKNDHNLNEYLENIRIERRERGYSNILSFSDKLLRKSRYSKQLETEADQEGLALFLKSNYSISAPDQVMDVLKYAYLPFDEIPFEKNYLENSELIFPENYFIDSLNAIDATEIEENDDKYSTHPNIKSRREAIAAKTGGLSTDEKFSFLVSETDFKTIQKIARYEVCRINLLDREYEAALFHAFILSKESPESEYIQTITARALYGLAIYGNHKKFKKVHLKEKNVQGNLHQVVHLFGVMSNIELNLVALHYAYRVYQQFPGNKDLEEICKHLMRELVTIHKITPDKLADAAKDTLPAEATFTEESVLDTTIQTDKYSNIKKQSNNTKKKKNNIQDSYIYYAFTALKKENAFIQMWAAAEKSVKAEGDIKEEEEEEAETSARKKKYKETKDGFKIPLKKLKKEVIPKILLFDPVYLKYDLRKRETIRYEATDAALKKFHETLKENARMLNIEVEILGNENLKANDAETLNDIGLLYDYFYEISQHEGLYLVSADQQRIKALEEKYGTGYISLMGTIAFIDKPGTNKLGLILTSIAVPVLIPYMIFAVCQPSYETVLFTGVYDLEENKLIYGDVLAHYLKDNKDLVNSSLYYQMMKMKKFIVYNESEIKK